MKNIEIVGEGFDVYCSPKTCDYEKAEAMAIAMAEKIKAAR